MSEPLTRAERVAAFLAIVSGAQDFPALSNRINDVMAVLSGDGRTMQHLANIILKDYSLTAKVLRTANGFNYNRAGAPLVSVTQAMILLGMDTVRDLASSLIVFEHYQRKSPGLKELMLLSMLSASHARETAERLGYPRPEEAHLWGLFRNLGEVLVACHAPAEYAAILARVHQGGERPADAAERVLGFTYEELGEAVCSLWGVATAAGGPKSDNHAWLERIVAFSHDLTTAVYRRDAGDSPTTLKIIVQKHGASLELSPDTLPTILERGIAETREVFKSLAVSFNDLRLRRQCETALVALQVDARADAAVDLEPAPVVPALARNELVGAISATIAAPGFNLNQTLLTILEAVLRAGPFDRAVFCVANTDRTEVAGRFGLGADVEAWLDRVRFPLSVARAAAPAGPALLRGTDLIVSVADPPLPDAARLLARLDVKALALLPVTVDGRFVGALCAERQDAPASLDAATVAFLRRTRDLMSTAIARARVEHPRPAATVRYDAVLRVLRGESVDAVSREIGVAADELERWRDAFLAAARSALKDS